MQKLPRSRNYCGIGIGVVGAEKAICGIGIGVVGAEKAICGIGIGVVGAEKAICGIGIGVVGAAIRAEAAKMSRIAVRARRMDSFTGGPSFLRIITHD